MKNLVHIKSKIHSALQSFESTLKNWKKNKETIVFTNGCFDIIHSGHIDALARTADFGTKMIIGLNSDSSVRKLKGENRPVIDEYSRAFLLAGFGMVDAVILFSEDTPYNLIKHIVPDFLVKGKDYKVEQIAGHDVVLNNGGSVETLDLVEGV